ncbi:hypothetical protein L7F22_006598 [Adiantum nelumboides]|nr:hypothetical protein [Adiantum nelumboides]
MGSSRAREIGSLSSRETRLQSHEELEMFMQMRKGEPEPRNVNAKQMPINGDIAFHAHDCESLNCFDAGPIEAGSALEAHVAARLSSSSIYRSNKPIMRYASKRNNTDLLTYGAGKNDFDWLMTPPDTPLVNSFEDATSGTAEGSIVHMLSAASQESGEKASFLCQ